MDFARFVGAVEPPDHRTLLKDESFRGSIRAIALATTLRASRAVLQKPPFAAEAKQFAGEHEEAWSELFARLGHWQRGDASLELPRRERVLIAAWHFPEVAALFSFAHRERMLLLVSQDAPWLEPLRADGCTLNVLAPEAARVLLREMSAGRMIAGMFDHHHVQTRAESSTLFGRTVQTPTGAFELASRFGYLMLFVAPRPGGIEVVAQVETARRSAADLADEYNALLEREVRRAPHRWLMWQALPLAEKRP